MLDDLKAVARAAGLNSYEAEILVAAALENASDANETDQVRVARATLESYINGDTRGRDLDALIIRGKHPISRKWRALTKEQ